MHYGEIKNCDIANGEGVRVTLFVSGCTNHCEHCFQPQTWDFDYGQPFTSETEQQLLDLLAPSYIQGLTLLGGEPFEPENQRVLVPFVRRVRETYPQKTVWAFSGFTLEELRTEGSHPRCEATDELLSMLDVLVDGRFVEALKDISLRFRGSSNQRLIDMKKHWHQARSSCCRIWTGNPVKHKEESSHHGNYGTENRSTSDGKGPQPPRAGGGAGTAPPVHRKV